jgi:hypothetical protein
MRPCYYVRSFRLVYESIKAVQVFANVLFSECRDIWQERVSSVCKWWAQSEREESGPQTRLWLTASLELQLAHRAYIFWPFPIVAGALHRLVCWWLYSLYIAYREFLYIYIYIVHCGWLACRVETNERSTHNTHDTIPYARSLGGVLSQKAIEQNWNCNCCYIYSSIQTSKAS